MIPPFDIFRVTEDSQPLWIEPEVTLEDAKARVNDLGKSRPGEYLIFSVKTGHKISITIPPPEIPAN